MHCQRRYYKVTLSNHMQCYRPTGIYQIPRACFTLRSTDRQMRYEKMIIIPHLDLRVMIFFMGIDTAKYPGSLLSGSSPELDLVE